MIDATPSGSYRVNQGRRGVMVGIIDTGVDGNHPDIKPNFDAALSRNFTTDIPLVDGPCEVPSCVDPPNVDENGHGTHVAGLAAAALNGLGTAGVAPKVTLVNIRAGQDAGFFFLQATVDAMVYAGLVGIDVINMSYFTDPWLFNCLDNPADSPEEQLEQRTIRVATQRAINFARGHGVTPVAALGNEHTDLGNPTIDDDQPRLPARVGAYPRGRQLLHHRADRDPRRDLDLRPRPERLQGRLLQLRHRADRLLGPGRVVPRLLRAPPEPAAREPQPVAHAAGPGRGGPRDPSPNTPFIVRDCKGSTCAFYQYLQGTSMASPHAAGVAALIVSAHGKRDSQHGGLTLDPRTVERILTKTAKQTPCPSPPNFAYPDDRDPSFDGVCEGTLARNGIYGRGVVNALTAVLD